MRRAREGTLARYRSGRGVAILMHPQKTGGTAVCRAAAESDRGKPGSCCGPRTLAGRASQQLNCRIPWRDAHAFVERGSTMDPAQFGTFFAFEPTGHGVAWNFSLPIIAHAWEQRFVLVLAVRDPLERYLSWLRTRPAKPCKGCPEMNQTFLGVFFIDQLCGPAGPLRGPAAARAFTAATSRQGAGLAADSWDNQQLITLAAHYVQARNYLTRHLLFGAFPQSAVDPPPDAEQRALRNLAVFAAVVDLKHAPQESDAVLRRVLGWKVTPVDLQRAVEARAKSVGALSLTRAQNMRMSLAATEHGAGLPARTKERFVSANAVDYAVVAHARRRLTRLTGNTTECAPRPGGSAARAA